MSATSASRSRASSESPKVYVAQAARLVHAASSGPQQDDTVGRTEDRVGCAFGVRHQADDVAAFVADAGDVVEAAVGVVDVANDDAVFGSQLLEGGRVADEVALEVVDRDAQDLAVGCFVGQRGRGGLDAQLDRLAQELQACVLLQRAGEQVRFGEHLKAVADADDRAAARPRSP